MIKITIELSEERANLFRLDVTERHEQQESGLMSLENAIEVTLGNEQLEAGEYKITIE